jgi:uncharacterized membrane protein YgaE (UPF0421/DUF939 family)
MTTSSFSNKLKPTKKKGLKKHISNILDLMERGNILTLYLDSQRQYILKDQYQRRLKNHFSSLFR